MSKCSCGLDSGYVFSRFTHLENELAKDKPDFHIANARLDDLRISGVERVGNACGLDVLVEKVLLDEAKKDLYDRNYDSARQRVRNADFQLWNKLLKCAWGEE
jgi:hypothetical protein